VASVSVARSPEPTSRGDRRDKDDDSKKGAKAKGGTVERPLYQHANLGPEEWATLAAVGDGGIWMFSTTQTALRLRVDAGDGGGFSDPKAVVEQHDLDKWQAESLTAVEARAGDDGTCHVILQMMPLASTSRTFRYAPFSQGGEKQRDWVQLTEASGVIPYRMPSFGPLPTGDVWIELYGYHMRERAAVFSVGVFGKNGLRSVGGGPSLARRERHFVGVAPTKARSRFQLLYHDNLGFYWTTLTDTKPASATKPRKGMFLRRDTPLFHTSRRGDVYVLGFYSTRRLPGPSKTKQEHWIGRGKPGRGLRTLITLRSENWRPYLWRFVESPDGAVYLFGVASEKPVKGVRLAQLVHWRLDGRRPGKAIRATVALPTKEGENCLALAFRGEDRLVAAWRGYGGLMTCELDVSSSQR